MAGQLGQRQNEAQLVSHLCQEQAKAWAQGGHREDVGAAEGECRLMPLSKTWAGCTARSHPGSSGTTRQARAIRVLDGSWPQRA
jgi:hypothetical protein